MKLRKAFEFFLECRTTIIPMHVYRKHEIELIAEDIFKYADAYTLQQFNPRDGTVDPSFQFLIPSTREELLELAFVAKRYIEDVRIKTEEMGEERV